MFPLLLKHSLHGAMYAYDSSELEWLKKQGWSDALESERLANYAKASKAEVAALAPKRAYRRKAA